MLNVYETLHLAASFHRLKDYLFTLNNPSSSNSYDYTNRTGHKYVNNKIKLNLLDQDSFEATINDILDSLALRHTSSTLIGDDEKRGVSGGEKKRLSIACELLSNPKILIADEPTSGLDSYQALNVISILHKIAREKNIGKPMR
jgi:ABC-type multidrug transport system ATPase subunit